MSRVVRAAEIGEYVYCHRAWWLRHLRGQASTHVAQMQAGTARHLAHGRRVRLAGLLRLLAALLTLAAGLILLGGWLLR